MATVTGLTAARMIEIEDASIVSGTIVGDNLVLTNHGGTNVIAGNVRGPEGPPGPAIASIDDAADVQLTTPAVGQVLTFDGTRWVNGSPFFPTGIVVPYGSLTPAPGFLLADGSVIPAGTLYNPLRAMYGTNLPDLRSKFIYGAGSGTGLLSAGGNPTTTLTSSELPAHSHTAGTLGTGTGGNHNHSVGGGQPVGRFIFGSTGGLTPAGTTGPMVFDFYYTEMGGDHTHPVTGATASAGSGAAFSNLPPYVGLYYIVKI